MDGIPIPTVYVVVVDDGAFLVGLHALRPEDTYQSATGAHGRIAKETLNEDEARALALQYLESGYRRNGGETI